MTATMPEVTTVLVARSVLLDALSRVALAAKRPGGSLPVLSCVQIVPDGEGLRFTTTNFDQTISVVIPVDGAADFPTRLVPCHRLLAIVGQLPEGTVTLAARDKHGVRITAGRARFDVAGMAPDEFPTVNHQTVGVAPIAVDAPAFVSALSRCATCASDAESRPILGGVHVTGARDGRLQIEATDGHQMTREWIPRATGPALELLIPTPSVPIIAKLFGTSDGLTVTLWGTQAVMADESSTRFTTRLVEGSFPNTAPLFDRPMPYEAVVDGLALLAAVKRVSALSSEKTFRIRLNWNADHVVVSGVGDDEAGRSEDVVPCELASGAPIRITFGQRLLLNSLSLRTAGAIRVGLKDGDNQMALRDDGSSVAQGLVMPLRDLGD